MEPDTLTAIRELLASYRPSDHVRGLLERYPLLLLVGVSGAGKDTVKRELLSTDEYDDFVSYTTRKPRMNHGVMEVDGQDYHFINLEQAERMLREGEFIEAAEYSGNVYGTGIRDLERAGATEKVAVNDIEVQGVGQYKDLSDKPIAVFLLPPSYEEWRIRLRKRYGTSEDAEALKDDLQLRMTTAAKELRHALSKDYFYFIVNDDLASSVEKVRNLVLTGARDNDDDAREVAMRLVERIDASI